MDKEKIAESLTMLRGGKKQEEVAAAVGISRSALAMYERGERVPRDEIKVSLAKYFGVSVQELFFTQE